MLVDGRVIARKHDDRSCWHFVPLDGHEPPLAYSTVNGFRRNAVARKRQSTLATFLSKASVESALKKEEFANALEIADALLRDNPDKDHKEFYIRILPQILNGLKQKGDSHAVAELQRHIEEFANTNSIDREQIAVALASTGEFILALRLVNTPLIARHIADHCMRANTAEGAPENFLADFSCLRGAIDDYEAGRDDFAREALQRIGLTSPFLEWKIFLRGLIAYANNDNARAIENWSRLRAEFVPATLAAPLWQSIDPSFRATPFVESRSSLAPKGGLDVHDEILADLKKLQVMSGRDQDLDPVWRTLKRLVPKMQKHFPKLIPRLAAIYYHAILQYGSPSDIPHYKKLFPPFPDDPEFLRLVAMRYEDSGAIKLAVENWKKYEVWLASGASGWPAPLNQRARAIILHRIGTLLESLTDGQKQLNEIQRLIQDRFGGKGSIKFQEHSEDYFARSAALAPDWSEPFYDLHDHYCEQSKWSQAEEIALDFLNRRPDDLEMLKRLEEVYLELAKSEERLAIARRAREINPLDQQVTDNYWSACIAAARARIIARKLEESEELLKTVPADLDEVSLILIDSLRATQARLRKQPQIADQIESDLLSNANNRIAGAWQLVIDATLCKLKPATKNELETRFKTMVSESVPSVVETLVLLNLWVSNQRQLVKYRGQSNHEKLIYTFVERSINSPGTEVQFESLVELLNMTRLHKLTMAIANKLKNRFPKSPIFPTIQARALVQVSWTNRSIQEASRLLKLAHRLAAESDQTRHKTILKMLNDLQQQISQQFGGLGGFAF